MPSSRWRVTIDDTVYDVEARSATWTGAVSVLVNGTELRRGPRFRDTTRRILFPLGRHLATLVWTVYGRGSVQYELVLEGRSVTTGGQPRPPADPSRSPGTLSLLSVALAAILGAVLWLGALPEMRLAVEGREVPAHVTGGRVETGRSTSYHLRYVFVTEDGAVKAAEGRVSRATYTSVRLNDAITVVYVPSAPDIQRPVSYDDRIWIALLVAMFAPGLVFTLIELRWAYRSRSMSATVNDRAVRTTATVDAVSKPWGATGIGMRLIVYRYEDAEGRSYKGTSPMLYVEEASAYAPGSRATIAYDPDEPGNSIWLGAADPRATVWVT